MTFSIGIFSMYRCNSFNNNDIMRLMHSLAELLWACPHCLRPIERDNIAYSKTLGQHALLKWEGKNDVFTLLEGQRWGLSFLMEPQCLGWNAQQELAMGMNIKSGWGTNLYWKRLGKEAGLRQMKCWEPTADEGPMGHYRGPSGTQKKGAGRT